MYLFGAGAGPVYTEISPPGASTVGPRASTGSGVAIAVGVDEGFAEGVTVGDDWSFSILDLSIDGFVEIFFIFFCQTNFEPIFTQ